MDKKKKFPGFYIEGHLLTYDTKMANKYFLDEEMASEELKFKKKRKIKRRAIKVAFLLKS